MRVDRRALHNALKELARLTARSPLTGVLVSGKDGTLTATATDLTTHLAATLPAEGDDITAAINAKILAKLIKPEGRGNAGDVIIEPNDETVTVTCDGLETRLPATDPTLFPSGYSADLEWSLVGMCDAKALQEALSWVLPAASTDSTRKHLQSVFVDQQAVAATDGHRLHLAQSPIAPEKPMLLPSSAAVTVARILKASGDQVILARHTADEQDHLRVRCGAWELTTRLMDEEFPPYQHVVPAKETQQTLVVFDTKILSKALAQVRKLSEGSVKLCINGTVSLSPWGTTLGEAEVIVPTITNSHDCNAPDLEIGLDGKYLMASLPRGDETVEMGFGGQLDPVRLDLPDGQQCAVIMPLRL